MSNFNDLPNRENLLIEVQTSWNNLHVYLQSLNDMQRTQVTDAAGWTVKDHVIHIAAWEKAALAMLEGKSKREVLDISPEIWEQDDDPINAVLQKRFETMHWDNVMQTLQENHTHMMDKIDTMTEDDLQLPHSHYQSKSKQDTPIIKWIHWDTAHHYDEHLTWIKAIVEQ